jgi:hypothetical protein
VVATVPTFYSEASRMRAREVVSDVATWLWVALWTVIGARIHDAISGFSQAGRVLQDGGANLQAAGADLGDALGSVPVVGNGLDALATGAFVNAGLPFVVVGQELESLLILVARLLALLVVAVMLVPWLARYVPWRARRLASLRAATTAIRSAPVGLAPAALEHALATRALSRLDYEDLLAFTPDPFGDFAAGRFDRLAMAERASVGLR